MIIETQKTLGSALKIVKEWLKIMEKLWTNRLLTPVNLVDGQDCCFRSPLPHFYVTFHSSGQIREILPVFDVIQ
jgi:hypothetical protein